LSDSVKEKLLDALLLYYLDAKSPLPDPLLTAEIMVSIAFANPARQTEMLARAEAELATCFDDGYQIQIGSRVGYKKEKWRAESPSQFQAVVAAELVRSQGNANRFLAQIRMLQAGKATNNETKCALLIDAYKRTEAAYRLLDGIGQQAAKQMQSDILIQLADMLKTAPSLEGKIQTGLAGLIDFTPNRIGLLGEATQLVNQINSWYDQYLTALDRKSPSPWLEEIRVNNVICEVKIAIYNKVDFLIIKRKITALNLKPQQALALGKEISLLYLTLPDHTSPEGQDCLALAKAQLTSINKDTDPLLYFEAKLWLAKLINADAKQQERQLGIAESMLREVIAAKQSPNTSELDARVIDEAKISLAENLIRQAYIKKEQAYTEPAKLEQYTNLVREAQALLTEAASGSDAFTQIAAKIWQAKIRMSTLGDTPHTRAEELQILREIDVILKDSRSMLSGGMLADVEATRGENLIRQVYILQNFDPASLLEAETALTFALNNGGQQTQFSANLWLAKLEKERLAQSLRDNPSTDVSTQITSIAQYLSSAKELAIAGTPEYADWQLVQGDFLLSQAYLAKDANNKAEFVRLSREALVLLESAAKEGVPTICGSRQTRAEAHIALAGALLSFTAMSEREELANLNLIPAHLELANKLIPLAGGQKDQALKIEIEMLGRSALTYRNLGDNENWLAAGQKLNEIAIQINQDSFVSPDLSFTLNY